jgi:hypothetical protein
LSNEKATDALIAFLDAAEAGIAAAKQILKEKGVAAWAPAKIKWTEEEGFKGKYEKSEDVNNPEFKAMLKDLQQHKGRLTHNGYFYWVFENGSTVGRKQMEKKTGQETP